MEQAHKKTAGAAKQATSECRRLESRSSLRLVKSKAAIRSVLTSSELNICMWACSHAHRLPFLW